MGRGSAEAVLKAARALFEGASPSLRLLAQATGRSEAYLARRARNEGWRADMSSQEGAERSERGASLPTHKERPNILVEHPNDPKTEHTFQSDALERRLVALSDQLVGDLETASVEGRASGTYDKARIDALSTMLRMVEKLGEMTRLPERAAEKQKRSDAELAAALSLVDARILELANELAGTMGSEQAERECRASDRF